MSARAAVAIVLLLAASPAFAFRWSDVSRGAFPANPGPQGIATDVAPTKSEDPHAHHAAPATPPPDPHAHHAMPTPPAPDPHAHHAMPAAPTPVPPLTDADRAAAFPPVAGHAAHDRAVHSYLLVDRLEGWRDGGDEGFGWEVEGWVGGDVDRLWIRGEGEHAHGEDELAVELLWGHGVSAWWDVVAGVRHEHGEGPSRTWLAVGVQGLAPYKIETKATAYVDRRGRVAARVAGEYETLLTSRWILQWEASLEAHSRVDPPEAFAAAGAIGPAHVPDDGFGRHGVGVSTFSVGARLRYEINRQFAPYVGIERERAFGGTADLRRFTGEAVDDTRVVAGIRFWF